MKINLLGVGFCVVAFAIDVHLGHTNWAIYDVFIAALNLYLYLRHDNSNA